VSRRSSTSFAVLALLIALVLAGCGGDGDERSAAAERAALLCDEARADIEALGLPAEAGIGIVRPWANRGTRLAKDIRVLQGATPSEDETLQKLATALDEYYAGLRLGHTIYTQTKSFDAYAATIERANAFLADADAAAVDLGAPECAVRPFADA
jgi:hypothetical protein